MAFSHLGLDPGQYVGVDRRFLRPAEVDRLVADYSKARDVLGWEPKVSFTELVHLMVDEDLKLLERQERRERTG